MNVRIRNTYFFSCIFLIFAIQGNLSSQNFDPPVYLEVVEGQSYDYQYQHIGSPTQTYVNGTSVHGTYPFRLPRGGGLYSVLYSANQGTLGTDTLNLYLRKPPSGQQTIRKIYITVIPSKVIAEDDFVPLAVNQTLLFPVSGNDYSNRGVLNITDISMENNGTASIVNNDISFTPKPGFEGLANFNYVVCDDVGTCDKATVHVCVGDPYAYANDTMDIITIKNNPVPIFTPLVNYTISTSPSNGSLNSGSGILNYEPNSNWTGKETIVYQNNTTGLSKTIMIDVMDVDGPNSYVKDDLAYSLKDHSTVVSILENDVFGPTLYNVQIQNNPQFGTLQFIAKGYYTYTPNTGFEGVDVFTYSASPNTNGSNPETGEVNIIVSDQEPALPIFDLRTPKNTPLVINYNIPVDANDFDFTITNNGNIGTVNYYQGHIDTLINGFEVEGDNLLIYYPNNNALGVDEIELEYCVGGNNNCPTAKVKIDIQDIGGTLNCIGTDCVWPGDSNLDGIVDLRDLLPTGWCIGDVGVQRNNAAVNPWHGQDSPNWGTTFPHTNADLKHLDANGDSIVNVSDTIAINQHYKKYHSLSPEPIDFPSNIPLFLGAPDTIFVVGPGDTVRVPIFLGDPNFPSLDMYGLTFSIDFDPSVVNPAKSSVIFDSESWANYTSPALHMVKKPFDGRIDAGFTRTNGVSANGYGRIGTVDFIIVDDLDPYRLPEFIYARISGNVMNGSGNSAGSSESFLRIKLSQNKDAKPDPNQLMLFPNPAFDFINYRMVEGAEIVGDIEIYSLSGQRMMQKSHNQLNGQIYTGNYAPGFYTLRITTTTGVVTKKFEVISGK